MQSLFSQLDALWATTGGTVPYGDARTMALVVHRTKEACFAQLEKLGEPRNLLSLVWLPNHCEVYAERHKAFELTWAIEGEGDFKAFAKPVAP